VSAAILAIDTTESACSAALAWQGRVVERFEPAARRHNEVLLPMIDALLGGAGLAVGRLDAIAFARGPGSFTGVRIAAAVAQGLAFAGDLPLVPVSSLQALAQGAARVHGRAGVLAAFDARMGEVYWGVFGQDATGVMRPLAPECVCAPAAVTVPVQRDWLGAGSGWDTHGDALVRALGFAPTLVAGLGVHARDVADIAVDAFARGETVSASDALPVYLRDEVAWARPA
jgi:tRNA threonylcarbamoyladenosine biosynthesis protein TsaB